MGDEGALQPPRDANAVHTIGLLKGEGIGPEVVDAAMTVLEAVESVGTTRFKLLTGGAIGVESERLTGHALSDSVVDFCAEIFRENGAILAGAGGGRFVYDLRRRFDLFCKISPLIVDDTICHDARIKSPFIDNLDVLVVRENVSGIYQGTWSERTTGEGRVADHQFKYAEAEVTRILKVAARIAKARTGRLTVVTKPHGTPTISTLWHDCAATVTDELQVTCSVLEVDHAAYELIQNPQNFDVVVTQNLFGDILSDLGGVLLGSRGLCYSGNFSETGAAVYQTNHGAAHDLANTDRANPVGQIASLAMLLNESFGLSREAALIENAVKQTWRDGYRTDDLATDGCRLVGTQELALRVSEALVRFATDRT